MSYKFKIGDKVTTHVAMTFQLTDEQRKTHICQDACKIIYTITYITLNPDKNSVAKYHITLDRGIDGMQGILAKPSGFGETWFTKVEEEKVYEITDRLSLINYE